MFKSIIGATMKRSSVMMNWKRKAWKKTDLSVEHYAKLSEYCKMLEQTGMFSSSLLARQYLRKNPYIFDVPLNHLVDVYDVCCKWHIDMTTLRQDGTLLTLPVDKVENTIMILDEMGVRNIHAALVSRYSASVTMRLGLFKAFAQIPESENVTHKLIECLGPFPPDTPLLETVSENLSVFRFRSRCWEWYLNWRLNLSETDIKKMDEENCIGYCGRRRSFRVMKQQIDHLCDEIGVTPEQILRRGCLKKGSASELKKVIRWMKTFAGIEMKRLIRVKPSLASMQYENVARVTRLLERNGFTDKMKRVFPEILLLPYEKVKKSIDIINSRPELRVLKNNPRILILVKRMTSSQVRFEYLHHHNVNFTVRALTSRRKRFEKLLRSGVDYCTGREIGISLEHILDLDAREIARRIKKHPFWRNISILSMHETVKLLLKKFPPEDIADNILLILYPKDRVDETLKWLSKMSDDSMEKKFSGKQTLAYCHYLIEREYHFTGDGVWRDPPKRQKRVFWEEIDAELSNQEDTEDAKDNTAPPYSTRALPQLMAHRMYKTRIKRR